jgi:hypothetical protein
MSGQLHHTVNIPDFFAESPKQAGYQAAHKMYDEVQNYFAQWGICVMESWVMSLST